MKIAVVGGASTYTPELVDGFATHRDRLPVDELVLLDINRERLDIVGGLARRILEKRDWPGKLTLTGARDQALDGASFVDWLRHHSHGRRLVGCEEDIRVIRSSS